MRMNKISTICVALGTATVALFAMSSCQNEAISAYDVAVNNGFVGTETEWLESLKGSDGANGKDASSLSLSEIYSEAVSGGYEKTYLEFIKEYMSVNYNEATIKNASLMQTVSISCNFTETSSYPQFGQSSSSNVTSMGSGVFYDVNIENGDAYVITNYHVVYDYYANTTNGISNDISIFLYGLEYTDYKIPATYIGGSIQNDIAVLKVTDSDVIKASDATSVTFGNSNDIFAGESCYAVGNPEGEGLSVVSGTISVVSQDIDLTLGKTAINVRTIRHDCAINSGNSGGGLFNAQGELIGIVNAKLEDTGVEGMCYALPVSMVKGLAELIIDNNETNGTITPSKCYLGITSVASSIDVSYDLTIGAFKSTSKIEVYSINEGVSTGILEVGDIINTATLNGVTTVVDQNYTLPDLLFSARVNDIITLNITRGSETFDVEITLSSSNAL